MAQQPTDEQKRQQQLAEEAAKAVRERKGEPEPPVAAPRTKRKATATNLKRQSPVSGSRADKTELLTNLTASIQATLGALIQQEKAKQRRTNSGPEKRPVTRQTGNALTGDSKQEKRGINPEELEGLANAVNKEIANDDAFVTLIGKLDSVSAAFENTELGLGDDEKLFVKSKIDSYKQEVQHIMDQSEPDMNKLQEISGTFTSELTKKLDELKPEESSKSLGGKILTAFKNHIKPKAEEPKGSDNKPKL